MENILIGCPCSLPAPCDTSTNSPHQVAFAPQAAKASNCQYFAASSGPVCSPETVILLLKNPPASKVIFYVTIESVSNYGAEAVAAYLAGNVDLSRAECRNVPVCQTNLGCTTPSAAEVCHTGRIHESALCSAEFLTQDIVAPLNTLRIDHQGGFVVTPGKSLAVVAASLCPSKRGKGEMAGCINVGIDLRWWETPCNSHP